ncbi:MAG: ABC transporter ATP-binding protein [Planctomycetota bacterium]
MSETIISVRDLNKVYGQRRLLKFLGQGFRALKGVSLEVGRGSVFGLLGPNGAGKTTLIKILLGLVRGAEGHAQVFGLSAGDPRARRRVGYLPEAHRLPTYLTGRQVLTLYGMLSGREKSWLEERMPAWLDRVGMADSADRKIREYSKGMQQRIGLAQALIHEPELVFLDEPTDGIDPKGRAVIRGIIAELKDRGVTVFINSHLLMEVEMICDRVVIMDQGRIIREGTIDEMTPKTGAVRFDVNPIPDDLGQMFDLSGTGESDDKGFELTVNDGEIDAVIDKLRARGISIQGIYPRKLTLEESFIDVVKREHGE